MRLFSLSDGWEVLEGATEERHYEQRQYGCKGSDINSHQKLGHTISVRGAFICSAKVCFWNSYMPGSMKTCTEDLIPARRSLYF